MSEAQGKLLQGEMNMTLNMTIMTILYHVQNLNTNRLNFLQPQGNLLIETNRLHPKRIQTTIK